jgi:hypothetical protein
MEEKEIIFMCLRAFLMFWDLSSFKGVWKKGERRFFGNIEGT